MPLLINGADVSASLPTGATFKIVRRAGDLTPAVGAPPTRPSNGDYGERLTGAAAVVGPRTLRIEYSLTATDATALELAKDALFRACVGGGSQATAPEVELALVPSGGGNGRQWRAYLTAATEIARRDPTGLARTATGVLVFVAPNPLAEATTATTGSLSTTEVRTALGTAPSPPLITLAGPFSSRVVLYEDGANALQGTFTITASVASGASVEVCADKQSVVHIASGGARTPQNDWLTAGDFFPLDPAHVVAGTFPAVYLNAGTGTLSFRPRWR